MKFIRQAEKSGIIVASQAVRKGEPLLKEIMSGVMTIGELEDMHFDVNSNKDVIRSKAMDYFKSIGIVN